METASLDERVYMFSRVLEVMSVFEELNNFTGLVALYSALNSSSVYRLKACWEVFFLIFAENAFYRLRLLLLIFIFDVFLSLKFLYLDS